MLNISELHQATLILDCAAMFILIGTLVYTSIYRKRGHIDDRLFLALVIVTMLMAVSDGVTYALDGGTVPHGADISLIFNNIFFLTFEFFCGLLAVYLDFRVYHDEGAFKKRSIIIMIPAMAMMLLILVNNYTRALYWVDPATSEYFQTPMYPLIFVGPIIYAVLGVFYCIKIDPMMLCIYLPLLLVRLFFGNILRGVSSTPLIFSMGIAFIHIHYMRLPFYDEEAL